MFQTFFFFHSLTISYCKGGEEGRQPPANQDVTKEKQGQVNQKCKDNTVVLTNWTEGYRRGVGPRVETFALFFLFHSDFKFRILRFFTRGPPSSVEIETRNRTK